MLLVNKRNNQLFALKEKGKDFIILTDEFGRDHRVKLGAFDKYYSECSVTQFDDRKKQAKLAKKQLDKLMEEKVNQQLKRQRFSKEKRIKIETAINSKYGHRITLDEFVLEYGYQIHRVDIYSDDLSKVMRFESYLDEKYQVKRFHMYINGECVRDYTNTGIKFVCIDYADEWGMDLLEMVTLIRNIRKNSLFRNKGKYSKEDITKSRAVMGSKKKRTDTLDYVVEGLDYVYTSSSSDGDPEEDMG